jgi:hypothetical protein
METYLFYFEGEWCFLNVYIRPNQPVREPCPEKCIYWIDWEVYSETNFTENNKNILCIDYQNTLHYYRNDNKIFCDFTNMKCKKSMTLIYNIDDLEQLKNTYKYRVIYIN